jgi:hypothetical protein
MKLGAEVFNKSDCYKKGGQGVFAVRLQWLRDAESLQQFNEITKIRNKSKLNFAQISLLLWQHVILPTVFSLTDILCTDNLSKGNSPATFHVKTLDISSTDFH